MNLITAAEVVTLAFSDKNFLTGKILAAHINIAHEGFLRPLLGDDFYNHLTTETLTADDVILVNNYLKAPLAMYVRYIILPDVIAHMSNTGAQLVVPQGTISASDRQAGTLREQAKANAEILMASAIRYIETNYTLFPLYEFEQTIQAGTRLRGGVIMGASSRRTISAPAVTTTTTTTGDSIVNMIADLRLKVGYANNALILCNENNYLYQFNSTSEAVDDGDITIAPSIGAGRWIMIKEIQTVNL